LSKKIKYIGRNADEQQLIDHISQDNPQVFAFWNELNDAEKDALIADLREVNLEQIQSYYDMAVSQNDAQQNVTFDTAEYYPAGSQARNRKIRQIGETALSNGKVAFLTVAGGQASRLDYEYPKGCYPISPINKKSLFQIFAEKIRYYSEYYGRKLCWYIMTSETNYDDTVRFFDEHNYWGLDRECVTFFKQGMLPAVTSEGKLILFEKHRIFRNPDGHGGILTALMKTGLLDKIKNDGVKYLSYFQVDNPLINMADTTFIGYHMQHNMAVTTKVIEKLYPEERLGVIGKKNGINGIIEYSDLPIEMAQEKLRNGKLKYGMGSTGVHIFSTEFLTHITQRLPIHCAKKKVTAVKEATDGSAIKTEIEAIKFETFVFDTIGLADQDKSGFFETNRADEFYPLKNKTGLDSIETCTNGQINAYIRWLIEAGIIDNNEVHKINKAEISPLFAPDKEIFIKQAALERDYINKCVFTNGKINSEITISKESFCSLGVSFGEANG
jgi:UDP-N-acetylglucosamine/UDP-N-acetylgalactosamine diphosphorylase